MPSNAPSVSGAGLVARTASCAASLAVLASEMAEYLDESAVSVPSPDGPALAVHDGCVTAAGALRTKVIAALGESGVDLPATGKPYVPRSLTLASAVTDLIAEVSEVLDTGTPDTTPLAWLVVSTGASQMKGRGETSETLLEATDGAWWNSATEAFETDFTTVGVANRASEVGTMLTGFTDQLNANRGVPVRIVPAAYGGTAAITGNQTNLNWSRTAGEVSGSNPGLRQYAGQQLAAAFAALVASGVAANRIAVAVLWNGGNEASAMGTEPGRADVIANLLDLPTAVDAFAQAAGYTGPLPTWYMLGTGDTKTPTAAATTSALYQIEGGEPEELDTQGNPITDPITDQSERWVYLTSEYRRVATDWQAEEIDDPYVDSTHYDTAPLRRIGIAAADALHVLLGGEAPEAAWFSFVSNRVVFDDADLPTGATFADTHLSIDDAALPDGVTVDGTHLVFDDG